MIRTLAALLAASALTLSAHALDAIQSTTVTGRNPPAGFCGSNGSSGGIALNRADRTLALCNPDGTLNVTTLLKALPAGRRAVEQGQADDLTVGFGATPGALSALLNAAQPRVGTTAALKALSFPYGRIRRDGFAAPGDGGQADYTWSASTCTAADDGAQVQPVGRTGCWIADLPSPASVRIWGADPSGQNDSSAAINAAAAAVGPSGALRVNGRFLINNPITATKPVTMIGNAGAVDQYATACPAGVSTFVAGGNIDLLKVRASGSVVNGICFEMAPAPGGRTAGSAIVVGGGGANSGHQRIESNTIINAYDGITFGDNIGVVSMPVANDNHINLPSRSGISVGRNTAYGAVNELRASNNTIVCQQGNPPSFTGSISGTTLSVSNVTGGSLAAGMAIVDASSEITPGTVITGGSGSTWTVNTSQTISNRTMAASAPYAANSTGLAVFDSGLTISAYNEIYGCACGTTVTPGANQLALFWGEGVQADSSLLNGLLLDATAPSASLVKAMFSNWWVGTGVATEQPVIVRNSGGGFVDNIAFGTGHVHGTVNSTAPLINLEGTLTGVSIVGTQLYADNNGSTNIGVRDVSTGATLISGVNFGTYGGTLAIGVIFDGRYGNKTVSGNNFANVATPLAWGSAPTTSLEFAIGNNAGLDGQAPTVASAANIAAPFSPSFFMSGTSNISSMSGFWNARVVTIIPTAAWSTTANAGGNGQFCNAITATALIPITARYLAPFNCWRLN